jgi:hypothetical protein
VKRQRGTTSGEIVETNPEEAIVGFFSMDGASEAVLSNQFDLKEEMSLTIKLARSEDPQVSVAGLKLFRSIVRDVAKANGLMAQISEVRERKGDDGTTVRQVVSTNNLVNRLTNTKVDPRYGEPKEHLQHHGVRSTQGDPVLGGDAGAGDHAVLLGGPGAPGDPGPGVDGSAKLPRAVLDDLGRTLREKGGPQDTADTLGEPDAVLLSGEPVESGSETGGDGHREGRHVLDADGAGE